MNSVREETENDRIIYYVKNVILFAAPALPGCLLVKTKMLTVQH